MCGICGVLDAQVAVDQGILKRMCDVMRYRGPDEEGYYHHKGIALGMRRLKVIDLDTGSQPIFNEDEQIAVIFNGEIYNYHTLRRDLLAKGHHFSTQSDTETLVHGYESYGTDFIEQLNGMFAFALVDKRQDRVVLARDRTAQKPLFYYHTADGRLIFASEIKVLLESGLVPRQLNPRAIYHYLSTQYVPGPETIVQGVYQLPAGHYAIWQAGEWVIERYWQPTYTPKLTYTQAEWIAHTRQVVTEAVERHMISDVSIGAYLSGGVDSSIVVALMTQFSQKPVETFSIGFDVKEYSELDHARRIVNQYQTNHHELIVGNYKQITDTLTKVVYHSDQPLADTSLMATYLLAEMTRQHVTVALTGDGGDEAFAGYIRYTLDRLLRFYRLLPSAVRMNAVPTLAGLIPERPEIPTDKNIVTGMKRLAQASSTSHKASILAWGSFFTESQKHWLGTPDWLTQVESLSTVDWLAGRYEQSVADSHLDKTLYADFVTYLYDDLMVKSDRMAMAHSLETRAPLLDNAVLDLAHHMPDTLRIRGNVQKWVLRQAFADLIPRENVNRVKRGFGMPVSSWLRGHLQDEVRTTLLDQRTQERGIFRPEAIQSLLDDHTHGRVDHGQRIWALFVLELWLQMFLDE